MGKRGTRFAIFVLTFCLLTAFFQTSVFAEDGDPWKDSIVTDRPDIAETSQTVGQLRFQIESSFSFIQDIEDGVAVRRYSFPTLFRFGVIDPLELRLGGEWFIAQTETGQPARIGFSDIDFGLKGHILDAAEGGIPSMAIMAMLLAPTGKDELSFNGWYPSLVLIADWDMIYNLTLGVNLGFDVPIRDPEGDVYARFLYAVAFGYIIHGLNNRFKVFVEVAGIAPLKSHKDNIVILSTGPAYLLTPNMQIDGFIRVGLTKATPDMQGGVGYSVRF